MTQRPQSDFTAGAAAAVARQAVIVAEAALWLARVREACVSSGCDPSYCRVRDSLQRSLDAERAELVLLQSQAVPGLEEVRIPVLPRPGQHHQVVAA